MANRDSQELDTPCAFRAEVAVKVGEVEKRHGEVIIGTVEDEPVDLTEDLRTLIFSDDRAAIEEICMGPDQHGKCPRAEEGHLTACGGKWSMNKGWNFKVAPDAEVCPLVSLGLAHRYLRAAIGEPRKED